MLIAVELVMHNALMVAGSLNEDTHQSWSYSRLFDGREDFLILSGHK